MYLFSELDKKNGFTLLIDRRNDKWSSIKNILFFIQVLIFSFLFKFYLHFVIHLNIIQEYFPSKINNIYILRPQSYIQRVLSTLFFQEDSLINSINFNPNRAFNVRLE